MIFDLARFVSTGRSRWSGLEQILAGLETNPFERMSLEELARFHYLYECTSSDLSKLSTFSAEPDTHAYLVSLVARAYSEIHASRRKESGFRPWRWFSRTLPQTFRRRAGAFYLALGITLAGVSFGACAVHFDPESKATLMPFTEFLERPSERVQREEKRVNPNLGANRAAFSAQLMTHNIQVALFTFAVGITWGIGGTLMLFYNGVILGAISADYIQDGQAVFLLGWLMPHGVIEIPAILVAGQCGFILAGALMGWGQPIPRRARLRVITPDMMTLASGAALLLVWAGIIEAFLSQYHAPVLPYGLKIAFGAVELLALICFLGLAGRTHHG